MTKRVLWQKSSVNSCLIELQLFQLTHSCAHSQTGSLIPERVLIEMCFGLFPLLVPEAGRFFRPGGRTTVQLMSWIFCRNCSISNMLVRTLRIIGSSRKRMRYGDSVPELADRETEEHHEIKLLYNRNQLELIRGQGDGCGFWVILILLTCIT